MIKISSNYSLFFFGIFLFLSSCASKNIHPELSENREVMVRQWTRQTYDRFISGFKPSEFANSLKYQNTLIFGNESQGLVSLYFDINLIRWKLPIEGGVISEINIGEDKVYFTGGDGNFYCVDVETGKIIWKYSLRTPFASKPTISQHRVFVTTPQDVVYAFDAGSGEWLWSYRRHSQTTEATIHGASMPLVDNGEVIVGMSDGYLIGLSVYEGKLIWEKKIQMGQKFIDVDAHPILNNDTLYVPSYDGSLYALHRKNRNILWRFESGGARTITLSGENIYLPSSDGFIYALKASTGELLWKFEIDSGTPTQIIETKNYLTFGSSYRYLYVLNKLTGEGVYRWDSGSGSGFRSNPTYVPSLRKLFLLSETGNLYTFYLRPDRRKNLPYGMSDGYQFLSFESLK